MEKETVAVPTLQEPRMIARVLVVCVPSAQALFRDGVATQITSPIREIKNTLDEQGGKCVSLFWATCKENWCLPSVGKICLIVWIDLQTLRGDTCQGRADRGGRIEEGIALATILVPCAISSRTNLKW